MNIYSFYITRDFAAGTRQVFPVYKDDLALEYQMENNERFYRAKLSGNLDFIGADYDYIDTQPFETVFTLEIKRSSDCGTTWSTYWTGQFVKTDCTFNVQDRKVTVKPETVDAYKAVLDGMEREFNLIELLPEIQQVKMTKRPVIQVYTSGENVVSCFCSGLSWEQDCESADGGKCRKCHFLPVNTEEMTIWCDTTEYGMTDPFTGNIDFSQSGSGTLSNGQGIYNLAWVYDLIGDVLTLIIVRISDSEAIWTWMEFLDGGGLPSVIYFKKDGGTQKEGMVPTQILSDSAVDGDGTIRSETGYSVVEYDVEEGEHYAFSGTKESSFEGQFYVNWYDSNGDFIAGTIWNTSGDTTIYDDEEVTAPTGAVTCKITENDSLSSYFSFSHLVEVEEEEMKADTSTIGTYERLVADREYITFGVTQYKLYPIKSDDIVANNRNCSYAIGVEHNTLRVSTRTSATPTKYGRRSETTYFDTPDDLHVYYPVAQSKWLDTSEWFYFDSQLYQWEEQGRTEFILKDAFPLYSVLSVLLGANGINSTVTFQGTATYSDFLYGTTRPVTPVDTDNYRLFLAPKSNVIQGEYQKPAMKAMVTLKKVLDMLRNVYQCYWFIDADGRLRIEHISWFKNGGSYSGTPAVGLDATTMQNVRNGKTWDYGQKEYSFEKMNMPERYQFAWMDEVTQPFIGDPLITQGTFVEKGRVDDVTVADFTSDVDYLMLAPENCSNDGFALLAASQVSGIWTVPFATKTIKGVQTTMQNYFLSFWHLLPSYWLYDVPTWYMNVNGVRTQSHGIQRMRKQSISLPVPDTDPDPIELVKTSVGDGEVKKMSINLTSRVAKIDLNFDTH